MNDKILEEILVELRKQTKLLSNLHTGEQKMPEEIRGLLKTVSLLVPKGANYGS